MKNADDLGDMLEEFDKKFKKNQERIKNNELNNSATDTNENEVWGIPEPEKTPVVNPNLGFDEPIDLGEDNEVSEVICEPDIIETDNIEDGEDNVFGNFDFDSLFSKPVEREPNYDLDKVPLPKRKNYIHHILDAGYTPTLCRLGTKKPSCEVWQETFFIEAKSDLIAKLEELRYDVNFGILTGWAKYNNCMVIDFDIKAFVETEQTKLISLNNSLIQEDYIKQLVNAKKLFIERSQSNGLHIVVSVNDTIERKGTKLVDYLGTKKPNLKIKEVHYGLGEVIETRGNRQHFVTYPSSGYQIIHNTIYELVKISGEEYNELENFVIDYLIDADPNFSKVSDRKNIVTVDKDGNKTVTENNNIITDIDQRELQKYQSKFSESGKDIEITQKLLEQNGYVLVSKNGERIDYLHPLSSKAESNFTLYPNSHSITNFSGNNYDFPNLDVTKDFATYGTLRACNILYKKLNPDSELKAFYDYLETDHGIKLVLDANEIMKNAKRNNNNLLTTNKTVYTNDFFSSGKNYYELCISNQHIKFDERNLSTIYNQLDIFETDQKNMIKYELDKNHKLILKDVKINYVYCVEPQEQLYNFDFGKNQVSVFVNTPLEEKTQNNDLWEWYIKDRFGEDYKFGKQYISAYCYFPEYEYINKIEPQRLCSLVLTGDRGTGKNTFVNLVRDIFGINHFSLLDNQKITSRFDTWKRNKLCFVDESDETDYQANKSLYNIMKKNNGNDFIDMEAKNEPAVLVKNQVSFIIASNNSTPIFTVFNEKPTNPHTNQFYVGEFFESDQYNNGIITKLKDSFLHYIKTVLKDVFYNEVVPHIQENRWIVSTPITERQILLFNSNKTKSDHIMENVVREIYESGDKWITPEQLKEYSEEHKKDVDHIVNLLVSRNLIKIPYVSRKIKDVNGVWKSKNVYVIDPDVLQKYVKRFDLLK